MPRPIDPKLSELKNFASAIRFAATGYPVVCAHKNIDDQYNPIVETLTMKPTMSRVDMGTYITSRLAFHAFCHICGKVYHQESTLKVERKALVTTARDSGWGNPR